MNKLTDFEAEFPVLNLLAPSQSYSAVSSATPPTTSTSSCGWCASAAARRRASTSRSSSTTRPRASSGWTRRAARRSSTASCTSCATTASGRSTPKGVRTSFAFSGQSLCSIWHLVSGKPTGYDRVRNAEIGNKDFELEVMEEAYTTEHWIVRIYKVKDMPNRGV